MDRPTPLRGWQMHWAASDLGNKRLFSYGKLLPGEWCLLSWAAGEVGRRESDIWVDRSALNVMIVGSLKQETSHVSCLG